MNTLIRNILLFVSGFILALITINSPFNLNSRFKNQFNSSYSSESSKNYRNESRFFKNSISNNEKPEGQSNRHLVSKPIFNSVSNLELSSSPENSDRIQEQTPTAPPTGRPIADNDEKKEDEKDDTKDKQSKSASKSKIKKNYDISTNANEASLSSLNESSKPYSGPIIETQQNKSSVTNTNQNVRLVGNNSANNSSNSSSNVIPDDFTDQGFQIAKRLYLEGSISEVEYLDYLTLGLNSNNSTHVNLALNELASIKNKNAFLILAQFANSSNESLRGTHQAILSNYTSSADLRFLGQLIDDSSSQETQIFAIHSLDIILEESSIDFSNPQIKDTLANNIGPSLVKIERGHPSYGLAQDLSQDINIKLS